MHLIPRLSALAVVLALSAIAQARPIAPETLSGLAKKADYLVVGEVLRVEDAGEEQSDTWKMPILRQRATIRVVRGIKSADATAAPFNQVVVEFSALKGGVPPDAPMFPQVQAGQIAVFPLKEVADKPWQFVSEEDAGMIMPAAVHELGVGWPAGMDRNVAFLYRELAGAFLYGDFMQMSRAGRYLDMLGAERTPGADTVFALLRAEIGENLLREDTRWVTMGVAAYIASGTPRPAIDALANGMITGERAVVGPADGLPTVSSLRLATLCLRKCSNFQLGERILILLVNQQETPGAQWGVATALVNNYGDEPMMLSMEREAFRAGKPGALYVADYIIKDRDHPLAAAAAEGARKALAPDEPAREAPKGLPYSAALRAAVGLLLRAGADDDFAYLLEQINQARLHDAGTYQAIMLLAGDSALSPPARVLDICRQYIDDNTVMTAPPWPGFRLCDLAALTAARIGKQDFGLKPDDEVELRDEAVAKAGEWLRANNRGPAPTPPAKPAE